MQTKKNMQRNQTTDVHKLDCVKKKKREKYREQKVHEEKEVHKALKAKTPAEINQ